MLEILMAMGVFAIGFVFIAAIFPIGAILQKEAVNNVNAQQVKENATAVFQSIQITAREYPIDLDTDNDLEGYYGKTSDFATKMQLTQLNPKWLNDATEEIWPIETRSYPTTITNILKRKFYIVPLLMDTNSSPGIETSGVVMKAFLITKGYSNIVYKEPPSYFTRIECANPDDNISIPKVYSINATASGTTFDLGSTSTNKDYRDDGYHQIINVGDLVMDNNGHEFTVMDVSDNGKEITVDRSIPDSPNTVSTLWFAPPGEDKNGKPSGKRSPTLQIITITGVAK